MGVVLRKSFWIASDAKKRESSMKLNGWQRLWVLASVIYFCLVVIYTIFSIPNPENIAHEQRFYDQLSPEMRQRIGLIPSTEVIPSTKEPHSDNRIPLVRMGPPQSSKQQAAAMANDHTIYFNTILSDKEMDKIAKEYWRIIEKEAKKRRLYLISGALLFWVGPLIAVYLLGWSAHWVYKGFKNKVE